MATPHSATTSLATAAIAFFTYFGVALLLLHLIKPDFTPVDHMMSDYAVGQYGWVMQTAFVALSGGILMLLLGLARSGPRSTLAWLGIFLLGIVSVGLVVSAIYKTDLEGLPSTREGDIHTISFLVNIVSIILASLLLSISFGGHPRWRSYRRTAVALAIWVVLAFVLQFFTLHRGMPYGLTNRFFVVAILAWLLTTSFRLRAVSGAEEPAASM
jgi:hypothetical membrane protein